MHSAADFLHFPILKQRRSGTSEHILNCHLRPRIPKDFETMIGDGINTFTNTTPAVNYQQFSLFEKVKLSLSKK